MVAKRNDNMLARLALQLAIGKTLRGAARELGVDQKTAQSWARLEEFKSRVERIRARIDDRTIGKMVKVATKAAGILEKLLDDPSPQIRLSAAKLVLDRRHAFESEAKHAKQLAEFQRQLTAYASLVKLPEPITVEARPALEGPPSEHEESPEDGQAFSDADE
jgi:hypothetical protein